MPRGNPYVWKKHGASYAELSGTTTSIERAQDVAPRRLPPVSLAAVADARAMKPAGTPSIKPHKGTGSFVLQNTWSLATAPSGTAAARGAGSAGPGPSSSAAAAAAEAVPQQLKPSRWAAVSAGASVAIVTGVQSARSYATETKSKYGPPPPDFRRTRSAGPPGNAFPVPTQPNDWRTVKQIDHRPELAAGAGPPPQPFRAPTAGNLLPTDVPPNSQFVTCNSTHFAGQSGRASQSLRPSGRSATQSAGYNIITGAAPCVNNAFEHWDGRDYRRHR